MSRQRGQKQFQELSFGASFRCLERGEDKEYVKIKPIVLSSQLRANAMQGNVPVLISDNEIVEETNWFFPCGF